MKPVQQTYTGTTVVELESQQVQVELAHQLILKAQGTQAAIDQRANCVGAVLEGMFRDAEGRSEWGINE